MNISNIRARMRKNVEECRDNRTGEVNHTMLAEMTCGDLDAFGSEDEIPEEFFETAIEFQ